MKTFVVVGNQWERKVEIDESDFEKYGDMAMEAMTRVTESILNDEEEYGLLTYMFPHVDPDLLKSVSEIAHQTRTESKNDSGRISNGISTRTSVEIAGLLFDGFALEEAAEVLIYPNYSDDGGLESERTFVKQLVQKYCSDGSDEELFSEQEIDEVTNS